MSADSTAHQLEDGAPVLELEGVVRDFGPVRALDNVDFTLRSGEVHALLGENGAGKTTLMNIACGILRANAGLMRVNGREASVRTPRDAFEQGLGIVHQNYRLVPNFTVAENIHLGWDATPRVTSERVLRERVDELSTRFGLDVDPDALASGLSVGELQRVAIVRTLARGARTLVLDEPTAVLTPQETEQLFTVIRALVADGHSIVFISHKLREVVALCDRVTVLRGGRRIATLPVSECDTASLARMMVGAEVQQPTVQRGGEPGEAVLELHDVQARDDRGHTALTGVDLVARAGEIVGVAGVAGNGQRELTDVMTGMRRATSGRITVDGRDMTHAATADFIKAGVGHVPEDIRIGLAMTEPLEISAVMKAIDDGDLRKKRWLSRAPLRAFTRALLERAHLASISPARRVNTLSGGQAQRVLVTRELAAGRRVIVAVHPSRGIDVSATARVHEALLHARAEGAAVVLVSEDLDEVLELSDRVVVIYEGRIAGEMKRSERFDRGRIGLMMGGGEHGPAVLLAS